MTAFREASTAAAAALDYPAAVRWIDEGVRYSDSIEQSHCSHVMRATLAMVSWAAGDLSDAQRRARRAIVDKGCLRGAMTAHWALGYVAMSRGELDDATAELSAAMEFGIAAEEIELVMPPLWGLAEVALQAGEPDRAMVCVGRRRQVGRGRRAGAPHAVRRDRRPRGARRRPAGRGSRLARRMRGTSRSDPGGRRRRAPSCSRHRCSHGGGDRDRAGRPGIGRRRLGPAWPSVGGRLGTARPGSRTHPRQPVRRCARRGRRGPADGGTSSIAGLVGQGECPVADGSGARHG